MSDVSAPELVRPAFLSVPSHVSTAGDEAADLADSLGMPPTPEQRLALDALLAERADHRFAAFEACLIAARQNLKTWVFEIAAMHDLFLRNVGRIVWTAHRFKTTQEAFGDLQMWVDGTDWLRKLVRKIDTANGDEAIELRSGSRIEFLARTSGGGRGLAGDVVVLDEALWLQPAMMGALLPVMSTLPNPQVRYGSSAGLATSATLRSVRDRGRAGGDPSLTYVEFCAPTGTCAEEDCDHRLDAEGCALDDMELIRLANPSLDRRITQEYIRNERRALPPEEFARERLGWWDDPAIAVESIPLDRWRSCHMASGDLGRALFALDVSLDRARATIGVAALRSDERTQLEVVAAQRGTAWLTGPDAMGPGRSLAESCREYRTHVALDATGPAGTLIDELKAAGVPVLPLDRTDVVTACGTMLDAVKAGDVTHLDDPTLNAAVAGAQLRQGEAYVWTRKGGADITPLYAVSLARWALKRGPVREFWGAWS